MKCRACNTTKEVRQGQWWSLNNYFGFTGNFCPDCYDKISHNSYRQPNRPKDYTMILLKLAGTKC